MHNAASFYKPAVPEHIKCIQLSTSSLQENTPKVVLILLGRMIDFFFAYVQLILKVAKCHLFF